MSAIDITIALLKADAGVTDLTSSAGLYPYQVPQGVTLDQVVVVNIISGVPVATLSGAGGYYGHRVQVDCLGLKPHMATDLGDAVLAALESVVKRTVGSFVDVDVMWNGVDMTDNADDRSAFRRMLQFHVQWRRAPAES